MRTAPSTPQSQAVSFLVSASRFSFFAPLFSLRDLPGFFPDGFCGDLSGMVFSNLWWWMRESIGNGSQGCEKLVEGHGRHADRRVADSVRDDQGARMEERAAGVDDVGHVAVLLVGSRAEERLTQPPEDPGGVLEVEQDCADAVGAHRTDPVGEHQPAGVCLDRRPAVAELDDFP